MVELAGVSIMPLVCAVVLSAFALLCGAMPERILAALLLAVVGLDLLIGHAGPDTYQLLLLAIDSVAFLGIGAVALRANRVYPLCIGAVQLVKLVSHFWRLSLARPTPLAHLLIEHTCFVCQLSVLALGLALHVHRRRGRRLTYADWTK